MRDLIKVNEAEEVIWIRLDKNMPKSDSFGKPLPRCELYIVGFNDRKTILNSRTYNFLNNIRKHINYYENRGKSFYYIYNERMNRVDFHTGFDIDKSVYFQKIKKSIKC